LGRRFRFWEAICEKYKKNLNKIFKELLVKNAAERASLNEMLIDDWLIGDIPGLKQMRVESESKTEFKMFSSTNPGSSNYVMEVIKTLNMIKKSPHESTTHQKE
jgi:hypothetical protein